MGSLVSKIEGRRNGSNWPLLVWNAGPRAPAVALCPLGGQKRASLLSAGPGGPGLAFPRTEPGAGATELHDWVAPRTNRGVPAGIEIWFGDVRHAGDTGLAPRSPETGVEFWSGERRHAGDTGLAPRSPETGGAASCRTRRMRAGAPLASRQGPKLLALWSNSESSATTEQWGIREIASPAGSNRTYERARSRHGGSSQWVAGSSSSRAARAKGAPRAASTVPKSFQKAGAWFRTQSGASGRGSAKLGTSSRLPPLGVPSAGPAQPARGRQASKSDARGTKLRQQDRGRVPVDD